MPNLEVVCKEHSWGLRHNPVVVSLGYLRELCRSWYTTNRPVPVTNITRYASSDADGTGDGSISNPWNRTQARNALPGTLVYLKGNFLGPFLIANNGQSDGWIHYKLWPGQTCTIDANDPDYMAMMPNYKSYIAIEGLKLGTNYRGIIMDGSTHCYVRDCEIFGNNRMAYSSQDNWIEGCTFLDWDEATQFPYDAAHNDGDQIAMFMAAERNVVYNNWFGTCSHAAISIGVYGWTDEHNYDNRIAFNTFRNYWTGAINVNGYSHGAIIEGNDVELAGTMTQDSLGRPNAAASREGILITGYDGIIRFNRFNSCWQSGIIMSAYVSAGIIQHNRNNHVYNNVVYDCTNNPFSYAIQGGTYPELTMLSDGNVIENNVFHGYKTYNSEGSGYFWGTFYPLWFNLYNVSQPTWDVWAPGGVRNINGNIIRNNDFVRADTNIPSDYFMLHVGRGGQGNVGFTKAQFESSQFTGCANNLDHIAVDFESTIYGEANFLALNPTSALKDAGYPVSGIPYNNSAPDIGVYEV